ncbi:MAG: hypothetical protein ACR2MY_10375 [Candidatus Dormibacteria bacterium]|uniref:Uncharacterized protein n=1 Tax=Candidatus Aeolococcus gillhamiae TaxID=3127015 RepID=A0A2W5Z5R9_9BACT|nr:MAG: hypothetical protein DLM65_07520 [Candidatus Dormibacter sp. RRmetagenome_bin12]
MRPNRLLPTAAIATLVVAAAAFATVAAPAMHLGAFAAAARPAASPSPHAKAQARCDSFVADLAKRLNTNSDNLKKQVKGAIDDQVAAAVKDGTITQAQADAITKKVDASKGCRDLPSFAGPRGPRSPGRPGMGGLKDILGAAASALKVDPAALQADVMAGKTLQQVAPAGMTQAQFDTAFKAELAKVLDPQVTAKKITAAQEADEIAEAVKVADMLWATPIPHMGGFGKHAFGRPGAPVPGSAPPPAPAIQ